MGFSGSDEENKRYLVYRRIRHQKGERPPPRTRRQAVHRQKSKGCAVLFLAGMALTLSMTALGVWTLARVLT